MNIISINLSKAARKKLKRYVKIPVEIRSAARKSFKLTHEDIINLGLHIQSVNQQRFWEKLELYGNYKNNNS